LISLVLDLLLPVPVPVPASVVHQLAERRCRSELTPAPRPTLPCSQPKHWTEKTASFRTDPMLSSGEKTCFFEHK